MDKEGNKQTDTKPGVLSPRFLLGLRNNWLQLESIISQEIMDSTRSRTESWEKVCSLTLYTQHLPGLMVRSQIHVGQRAVVEDV